MVQTECFPSPEIIRKRREGCKPPLHPDGNGGCTDDDGIFGNGFLGRRRRDLDSKRKTSV
ncbi:Hypothetical predicted protein [Mytilus galloprovincialis]|nr:Hypothetical predicted protein [Mytilus galloprovincialis]